MIVKNVKVSGGERWGFPGDLHFDEHDPEACWLMLQVFEYAKITGCALIGDTFESAGISRHPRLRRKFRIDRGTIKAERQAAEPFLRSIQRIVCGNSSSSKVGSKQSAKLKVLTGNHETWWEGVQEEYPGLADTPWFELYGDLFDGWQVHKEYVSLKLGPLLVCHGHRLRGSLSKYSAAAVLANYPGQNTLYGHTHRVDSCTLPTFKYGIAQDHGAWTIGHMRDLESTYKDQFLGPHAEKHKQGFAIVDFFEVEGKIVFKVNQVTIDRRPSGKPYCVFEGKVFGV